jgi:hypothetical protein
MARPAKWLSTVRTAIDEAVLAAQLYNDPGQPRGFEGFTVHMHMAWLYLLQAKFERDGIDTRYRRQDDSRRFVTIDGEHKRWELGRCAQENWPDENDPVRRNLEFFIALRNKIEHRHASPDANLAMAVAGHAQANLLNFEEELTGTFGAERSLANVLRFPVFVGTFTVDGERTMLRLRGSLPADLRRFIADYHAGLPEMASQDPRFELRLRVVLEATQRDPSALAIRFMRWDDMTDEARESVLEMGRRGQVIVREQRRAVVGHGLLRPREAEQEVAAGIPFRFTSNHFLRAWQRKGIRPPTGDEHPERTDERYCVYDALGHSYGYTRAWVRLLIEQCSTASGFQQATGRIAETVRPAAREP